VILGIIANVSSCLVSKLGLGVLTEYDVVNDSLFTILNTAMDGAVNGVVCGIVNSSMHGVLNLEKAVHHGGSETQSKNKENQLVIVFIQNCFASPVW